MNKKKLYTLVGSLVLVGAIGVGATLAYFTDNDVAKNVVTMGHVDIDLDEPNYTPGVDNVMEDLVPGETITKDPTITVAEDSQPAFIRAKIEFLMDGAPMEAKYASELEGQLTLEGTKLVEDTSWKKGEGNYYYFQYEVDPGEKIVLFDEVTIPSNWGNDVADSEIQIIVSAEAIQSENFEPNVEGGQIVGWNGVTVETYNPGN